MFTGSFEFRRNNFKDREPEIVAHVVASDGTPYCYTVLFWGFTREGWEVYFVGNRPFKFEEPESIDLWRLMRHGQSVLDSELSLKETA